MLMGLTHEGTNSTKPLASHDLLNNKGGLRSCDPFQGLGIGFSLFGVGYPLFLCGSMIYFINSYTIISISLLTK